MSEFSARIRRVRTKGGADVSILPTTPQKSPKGLEATATRHLRNIADMSSDGSQLDGFMVIGFYSDATSAIGFLMPERIPPCLLPAYVAEMVRRDVITGKEAERVFDNNFQWVEG